VLGGRGEEGLKESLVVPIGARREGDGGRQPDRLDDLDIDVKIVASLLVQRRDAADVGLVPVGEELAIKTIIAR